MDVMKLGQRIAEARKTADGAELGTGRLVISESELAGIYADYSSARGYLRDLAVGVAASQLRIARVGLGSSLARTSLGTAEHAQKAREVAELDCLLTTLKEAQAAKPPLDAKQMYARYVAKVAAALDH